MKNFSVAALVLSLTPCLCSAQNSKQYVACIQNAQTQATMNACANQEFARADSELNKTYRAVLAKTAKQPETAAKIKTAQKSWLVYRDAYLEAMFPAADKQTEYGSIYPMQLALLRSKLTRQQTAALKDLLRQHTN
jgi:uncharacterized protein YecT (DUF1311 family)